MTSSDYSSNSEAFRAGAKDAFGAPAAVLGAGYIGFGALAVESGFSIWLALLSSVTIWALPGQLVLLEMSALGAAALVIVPTVMLTSARFLPMTVTLMPVLRDPSHGRARLYFTAQFIAMTGWAWAMRRCPDMPPPRRLPYFSGFALTCWGVSVACTVAGFQLSATLPPIVKLGLVFLNPVYFVLILSGDVRHRLGVLALACGALAGPLSHLIAPKWSVLLGGFIGGTAAYYAHRWLTAKETRADG